MRGTQHLLPEVREKALALVGLAKAAGVTIKILDTLRTSHEQNSLYAKGRTAPGPRVTNARAGDSYHNYGMAFDFVVMESGVPNWNAIRKYRRVGYIAESLGLEWGGRWSFKDWGHCQYSYGLQIAELKSGRRPTEV